MDNIILKQKLKEKYKDEEVFVIPFSAVAGIKDGLTPINDTHGLIWTKFDTIGKYIYRYEAEYNPSFQQLIPYVIIQNEKDNKYFVAKRTSGDFRLQNSYSLGFGGHINPCDGTHQVLLKAMVRELYEELYLQESSKADFIGYIRDYKSPTNDHIGCIFLINATKCEIKEVDNLIGSWMTLEELIENYFKFENWSQYIIDYLFNSTKK